MIGTIAGRRGSSSGAIYGGRCVRLAGMLLCLVGAGLMTSCGGNKRPATVKVRGTIQWQKQPVGGAQVMFHPVAAVGAMEKIRPYGRTDSTGAFELTSFLSGDGCPAGEYRVTVIWPQLMPGATGNAEHSEEGPDRFKGKYADPATSGLTVTVRADQPQLPPIVLP